jgi:hypothetical protein
MGVNQQPVIGGGGGGYAHQPVMVPPVPMSYPSIDPNMPHGIEMVNPNPNPDIVTVTAQPIDYVDQHRFASQITTGTGKPTEYNHKNRCFPGSFLCNLLALVTFVLFFAKVDWMHNIVYGRIVGANSSSSSMDSNGGFDFLGCYKPPYSGTSRRRASTTNATTSSTSSLQQNEYVPATLKQTDSKYTCVDKFDRSFRSGGWTNPSMYYFYVGCFAISPFEFQKFDRDLTTKLEKYSNDDDYGTQCQKLCLQEGSSHFALTIQSPLDPPRDMNCHCGSFSPGWSDG